MGKKFFLTSAVAALAALGAASGASAASSSNDVTDFSVKFTSAKLVITGLLDDGLEVPGTDPALAGKTINVAGTLSKGGKVSIAQSGFDFPAVSLDGAGLPIPGLVADIVLTSPSKTGTFNTTTGAVSIPLSLGVSIGTADGSIGCLIKGLNFTFGTGSITGPTLIGEAWNKTSGNLAIVGKSAIPDVSKIPLSECPIAGLAAGLGISGAPVGLKLVGKTTIGTSYKTPAVGTISGSVSNLSFSKTGSGSNTSNKGSLKVKCSGTSTKNRGCAGTITITIKGQTVTVPFTAGASKTVTVNVPVTAAQRSAIGTNKKTSASIVLDVENGTGKTYSGNITLKK